MNLQCESVNPQRESMNLHGESANLQRKSAGLQRESVNLQAKSRFFGVGGAKNLVAAGGGGRIMRGVSALLVAVSLEVSLNAGVAEKAFLARRQGAKPHSCTE
jgi:hypothetical protein